MLDIFCYIVIFIQRVCAEEKIGVGRVKYQKSTAFRSFIVEGWR